MPPSVTGRGRKNYLDEREPKEEPVEPAAGADPEEGDDAEQIARFEEQMEFPGFLDDWVKRFDEDRRYINEDCMLIDETDTVATNYALRNQYVVGSQINCRLPGVSCQPLEYIGMKPPELTQFSTTMRVLLGRHIRWMNWKRRVNGAAQDAMTSGLTYLKIAVQEDPMRDPIGTVRHNDALDNIARLKQLQGELTNEDGEIDAEDPRHQDLVDLTEYVRNYLIGQVAEEKKTNPPAQMPVVDPMTGQPQLDEFGQPMLQEDPTDPRNDRLARLQADGPLDPQLMPEVPHFIGFNMNQVMPEDLRWDYSIIRPEEFYDSAWVGHRVYMSAEDIKAKWGITDDYFKDAKQGKLRSTRGKRASKGKDQDPADRSDAEADMVDGNYAVWERWDKNTGCVYVWCAGHRGFLTKYVPEVTWENWYPFFPVYFNRVTGRYLPISDTQLVKQLQNEINTTRTHMREARKSSYPRFVCKKGLFTKDEKAKFERALPYSITEATRADGIKEGIHEIAPVRFTPQLYDNSEAVREMEIMQGVSQQAAGGVGGAKFATETAIADKRTSEQSDYRRLGLEDVCTDMLNAMAQMSNVIYSEAQVREITGIGAFWPDLGRDKLLRLISVEVVAGSAGKVDTQKRVELYQNVSAVAMNVMKVPGMSVQYVLEKLFEGLDIRDIDMLKLFPAAPPGTPGIAPPAEAAPPGGAGGPEAPGAVPAPEGAPPMSEPRAPENMPNNLSS